MFIFMFLYCLINRDVIDKIKKNFVKKKKYFIFICVLICIERIIYVNYCFRLIKLKKKNIF